MFHQKRQHTIYSAKTLERPKKSCKVFQFPRQVIKRKKVKAGEKKMKKYKELYKGEKQRHEEALQRYQEDHADQWRSLNFTKRLTRRIKRFYSLKYYPNQTNLHNYQNQLIIQARKNRSLKKHQVMEKRPLQRLKKKLKRLHSLKKHQNLQSLLIQTQMMRTMNKNLSQKIERL